MIMKKIIILLCIGLPIFIIIGLMECIHLLGQDDARDYY
jgi:hypothetical protein